MNAQYTIFLLCDEVGDNYAEDELYGQVRKPINSSPGKAFGETFLCCLIGHSCFYKMLKVSACVNGHLYVKFVL